MGTSPASSPTQPLDNYLAAIQNLIRQIIQLGGFDLSCTVRKASPGETFDGSDAPAYVIEFSGADFGLLLEKNAALLDAIESVVLKAVRMDDDAFGKIVFDCRDWRRSRVEELKLMAQVAAERVVETGDPFTLSPMNARERRIIHLALKDQIRVRTQSDGLGPERRVVIVKS